MCVEYKKFTCRNHRHKRGSPPGGKGIKLSRKGEKEGRDDEGGRAFHILYYYIDH